MQLPEHPKNKQRAKRARDFWFFQTDRPTWVFAFPEGPSAMFGLSGSQVVAGRREGDMECCGYTFCNVSFLIAYCGHFVSSDDI